MSKGSNFQDYCHLILGRLVPRWQDAAGAQGGQGYDGNRPGRANPPPQQPCPNATALWAYRQVGSLGWGVRVGGYLGWPMATTNDHPRYPILTFPSLGPSHQ